MRVPTAFFISQAYWKFLPVWSRIAFKLHAALNYQNQKIRDIKSDIGLLWTIIRAIWFGLLTSSLMIVGIEVATHIANAKLSPNLGSLRILFFEITGVNLRRLDNSIYKDLAALLGVLASIYFASIAIVASSSFPQAATETRRLIWEERYNRYYFTYVVSVIAFLLQLTALNALGFTTGVVVFIFAWLVTFAAVLGFLHITIRLFAFFSPTVLADSKLIPDLAANISNVLSTSFQFDIPAIQQHNRKLAESSLSAFDDLINSSFVVEGTRILHGKEQLKGMLKRACDLLRFYGLRKASIPSDSYWFRRTNRQLSWFTSNSSSTDIGMLTGGSLMPESVPDHVWFEKELIGDLVRILEIGLAGKDRLLIATLLGTLQQYIEKLVAEHSSETAFLLLENIRLVSKNLLLLMPIEKPDFLNIESGLMAALAIGDNYGLAPLSIIVGTFRSIESLEPSKIEGAFGSAQLCLKSKNRLPRYPHEVLEQLEFVRKALEREIKVEGKPITADWYVVQAISIGAIRYIAQLPNKLLELIRIDFVGLAETLISEDRKVVALPLIERGLEACSKCSSHFKTYRKYYEELIARQTGATFKIDNVDWDAETVGLEKIRTKLIELLADISDVAAELPEHTSIPDFFGKAYWVISEEAYGCILDNNTELFSKLFPVYFSLTLSAFTRFQKKFLLSTDRFWYLQCLDVLKDLFSLSGTALIYRELGVDGPWNVVWATWETYFVALQADGTLAEKLETMISFVCSRTADYAGTTTKREITRFNWMQRLSDDFRKRGLLQASDYDPFISEDDRTYHSSRLIEYMQRDESLGSTEGAVDDVFILEKLIEKLPSVKAFQVKVRLEDTVRVFERIDESRTRGTTEENANP